MCNSGSHSKISWFLYVAAVSVLSGAVKADCVRNQTVVPACLSGTVVSDGYAGAVIQEDGQSGLRQVMQGDIVAGWTVDEIGPGYVALKRGTRTARLELPQSQSANVELVQQGADDPPRPARHGPVNNRRSAAREHD